jgi:hypothetical protein
MKSIFSKLPNDIINYILVFNERFIIRNGELVSIISKNDYRYKLLHYITIRLVNTVNRHNNKINLMFYLNNLCDIVERKEQYVDNDMIEVRMDLSNSVVKYNIFIGRLKLKDDIERKSLFYVGDLLNYTWHFYNYFYERY